MKTLSRTLLATALSISATTATADWYTQATLGNESRQYMVDADIFPDTFTTMLSGPILGLSFINSNNFYISLEATGGDGDAEKFEELSHNYDTVEDDNWTISVGTKVSKDVTFFAGINRNSSDITNGDPTSHRVERHFFETEGYVFGFAKNFTLDDKNSLSLSAALGIMDTSLEEQYSDTLSDGYDTYSGSSTGISTSLAYVHRVTPKVSMSAGLKGQIYSYDDLANETNQRDIIAVKEESRLGVFLKSSYLF